MIKGVVFDWGGVLIDEPSEKMIEFFAKALGVKTKIIKKVLALYMTRLQKGLILEKNLWYQICAKLKVKEPTINSLWKEAVIKNFSNKKEVWQIVKVLKKKGYQVGFLSNTEIPTMEYFYDKKYERYFDATVFSCVEKTVKPQIKIYNIILKKLNLKPPETIFIDDKITYVKKANQLGFKGIVFKTPKQIKKKLTLLLENLN